MRGWLRGACARTVSPRIGFEKLEDRLTLTGAPTVFDFQVGSTAWSTGFVDYLQTHSLGDEGYRVPVGSSSQVKSLPWNNIDKLSVTFSEDVNVLASHLSLTGVSVASVSFSHFEYDPRTFTATWTLAAALPKNSYRFEIDGDGMTPVKDLAGNALDGEWTTSSTAYPSGNGAAGGDFAFDFRVLPGDLNQSSSVDLSDWSASSSRQGATTSSVNYLPLADVDGSGSHTSTDTAFIYSKLNQAYQSGSPVGASNDAPSSNGWRAVSVNANAIDLAIDLWDDFADAETADSQLTYSIKSTSNSSVWSSQSINTLTGELHLTPVLNATGRSTIIVTATDGVGQMTSMKYYIDVGNINIAPEIYDVSISRDEERFTVSGYVLYDGDIEGLMVTFTGAITGRARVLADGSFEFVVDVPEEEWGYTDAALEDWYLLDSDVVQRMVGNV